MTAALESRGKLAAIGGVLGALLALPVALASRWEPQFERLWDRVLFLMAALPVPALQVKFSNWSVVPVNAVLWSAAFVVVGSRSRHWSAGLAKGVTVTLWVLWALLCVVGTFLLDD